MNEQEEKRTERPWTPGHLWAGRASRILNENAEGLFEALDDLVNGIQQMANDDRIDVDAAVLLADARAALAKALGGQP